MAYVPRNLALTALLAMPLAHAAEPPTLRYTVTPVLAHGDLQAVDVELTTEAGPDGRLDVVLPGTQLELSSNGSLSAGEHGHLVLSGAPHAPLTLRYRRRGDDRLDGDWDADPYMSAGWLVAPCPSLLAMPADDTPRRVEVLWKLNGHWRGHTTLPGTAPTTLAAERHSVCYLGRDVTEVKRPLASGGTLRFYTTDPDASRPLIELAGKALAVAATDAGGASVDYPVYMATVNRPGPYSSSWSQASGMGIVQERDADPSQLAGPLVSAYAQLLDPHPTDPATAWYTQGLRSYLLASDLLAAKTLSRTYVAAWFDQVAGAYGSSAFRRASNARIAAEWTSSPDLQSLPAQRGTLFGVLLDARLREATGGKANLADVLRHMERRPADPAAALIAAVQSAGGGDVTPLYEKYIVRGELLQLPGDALGPCMSVRTDADGYGWQVQRVTATCGP